jgi:hypothetical protein
MSSLSEKKNSVIYPGSATHTSPGLPVRAYRASQAAYRDWDTRPKAKGAGCEKKVTTHKTAGKK